MLHDLRGHVYGQDIAIEQVAAHLRRHVTDPAPPKALVLSLNGPTGTGKTYMSTLIAKNLFVNGMKSKFVRKLSQALTFVDSSMIPEYQVNIRSVLGSILITNILITILIISRVFCNVFQLQN